VNWAWSKDLLKVVLFVIGQNNSHEPQLVLRWGRLAGEGKVPYRYLRTYENPLRFFSYSQFISIHIAHCLTDLRLSGTNYLTVSECSACIAFKFFCVQEVLLFKTIMPEE